MDETIIDDNNEMIAIYDGWKLELDSQKVQSFIRHRRRIYHYDLEYHSSWDWLMPVWKKAGSWLYEKRAAFTQLDYTTAHRITKQFIDACQKVDIDAAYLAIIGAVTFINELTRDDYDGGTEGRADITTDPQ